MPFAASRNSVVTVRIILGVSHSLLPNPFGPNRSWVYLSAFATSPQLPDVMTNWAATHLLIAAGKTCGAEWFIPSGVIPSATR